MATIVMIPAFEPDEKLVRLAAELKSHYFDVLIVNDGSSPSFRNIFDQCRGNAEVIGYDKNAGKGAALKFGMKYIREHYPSEEYFITADADGQHSVRDICRVREELRNGNDFVLATRTLRKDAPARSRVGNGISKFLYTIANAHYLPDNQSGLRGFSAKHIQWMLDVRGEKYDYEFNVILIAEKQGIKIRRLPVETIYFDNNSGTHFRPVADTVKIYERYFETNIFMLAALALNLIIVILESIFFGYRLMPYTVMLTWGIYAVLCFVGERYTIFRNIDYTPGTRRLIISIFKFTLYAVFCIAGSFTPIPFAVFYVFAMVAVAFGEYYMLKVAND